MKTGADQYSKPSHILRRKLNLIPHINQDLLLRSIVHFVIISSVLIIIIDMRFTGSWAAPIHHHRVQMIHVMAGLPSLTMHATFMSRLMDNFLAPQYISVKHLTFTNTEHLNILSNEGLHQFNT